MSREGRISVGGVLVEPALNRVANRSVEPRVMDVLVYLAERRGAVVSREELLGALWNGTAVGDEALTRAVSKLRKAFDDDRSSPRVIETVSKRGYRLVAPVTFARSRTHRRSTAVAAIAIAVVAIGLYATLDRAPDDGGLKPLISRPLTSFPGREIHPALSPDGEWVAFAWQGESGDNWDIYLQTVHGSLTRRLTTDPAPETRPAWSPDGESLAFIRQDGETCAVIIKPVTGDESQAPIECGGASALAWSPDDGSLVYARGASLHRYDLKSRREDVLTSPPEGQSDSDAAFSPDGRRIAFVRSVAFDAQDIFVIESRGRQAPVRVTDEARMIRGLTWTGTGEKILFSSHRSGPFHLWTTSLGGGEPRWAAIADGKFLLAPSVSPGASRLVYETWTYDVNIWRAPLGGNGEGDAERLIASTQWDGAPRFSPDGNAIVFTSLRSGHMELWLARHDGSHLTQLTRTEGPMLFTPRWSPDGTRIAFAARVGSQADVFVVDRASRVTRQHTSTPEDELSPSWSLDGQRLYFASNRSGAWEVWTSPASGGAAVQLTTAGGFTASECSDGKTILYSKRARAGLYRRELAGGEEETVFELPASARWQIGRDGRIVFRATSKLARMDLETGVVEELIPLTGALPSEDFSIAPDGGSVLFARMDHSESDLMLVEPFPQ